MEPTTEQTAVLNDDGNIVVTAIPGSGKTYTVVKKIERVMTRCPLHKGVIAISYTNQASDELKSRCKKTGIAMNASFFGTMDKFYISQVIIQFARQVTNNLPEYKVVSRSDLPERFVALGEFSLNPNKEQVELLLQALSEGYILLEKDGEIAYWFLTHLDSVRKYISARYSYIFIDEYQDCGKVQHEVFLYIASLGVKAVAVGDKDQAIYAYADRFPRFLLSLISQPGFSHYELTKNNRCHESIANYSLALLGVCVPVCSDIRVFKVNVDGGEYDIAYAIDTILSKIKEKYSIEKNSEIAILCRGNAIAKLFHEALNTSSKLYTDTELDNDSSDVGRLFKRILVGFFSEKIQAVDMAEEWFSSEYEPLKYRTALSLFSEIFHSNKEDLYTRLDSFVELARMCCPGKNYDPSLQILRAILMDSEKLDMFSPAKDEQLNIMTIHKSKGLEFDAVFHMDLYEYVFTFPNSSAEERQQAINLHYVGITRAKKVCYLMNGNRRFRPKKGDFYKAEQSELVLLPNLRELRQEVNWQKEAGC